MGWWTAAATLTPVHAWDARSYNGVNLPDMVGNNALSSDARRLVGVGAYWGVSGDLKPFLLGSNVTPAANSVLVFFADYSLLNHIGNGVIGFSKEGSVNYFTAHVNEPPTYPANFLVAAKNDLKPRPTLSDSMVWGQANFIAIVFDSGTTGRAYVNGGWGGTAIPRSHFPDFASRIGWQGGSGYQLSSSETLIAAGYWTGKPSLTDLQNLEAACRSALTAPPVSCRGFSDAHLVSPLHPLANRPKMGFDSVAKDQMLPVHRGQRGRVVGTLFAKGQPDAPMVRRLRCFDEQTGALLGQTISANDGGYFFSGLDPTRRVFVVAFDDQDHYRAVIADKLLPQLEV